MALKKPLLEAPPSADSSSYDEKEYETKTVNDQEEEKQNDVAQDSDDDDEERKNSKQDAESESESESGSQKSNTTPSSSGFTVKPIVSKPKPKRKTTAQPNNDDEENEAKSAEEEKRRKVSSSAASNGGNPRLFSEDDEIALLEGMTEYQSEKGSYPYSDMADFHAFVKARLSVEVSKSQMTEKIRRLKKKYMDNAAEEGVDSPALAKPHDLKKFELSKKIWGFGAKNRSPSKGQSKQNRTAKKVEKEGFLAEFPSLSESLRQLSCPIGSENLRRKMEESMALVRSSKAKQLEKKWKKLEAEEIEVQIQRAELARETYQLVLDAIKSSD